MTAACGPEPLGCPAETVGLCDIFDRRYIHDCGLGHDHPGAHECACGRRWTELDPGLAL